VANLQGREKDQYVQQMFGRVAKRYNLLNRVMTAGQDQRWRRFVIQKAQIPKQGVVLDLATGTGDLAFEALKTEPTANVIGADFALPMMHVGQKMLLGSHVGWCGADAMNLPFSDVSFDVVVSGFLVRNVSDLRRTLAEQVRVLKAGGRVVILDTTPPPRNILRPAIIAYLKFGIPVLGRVIGGKETADAYHYLPESTQAFRTPDELASIMREVGIEEVAYTTFMFGTQAVHWGVKT
jgi:demethylmenaquinone methyltransferase / 2-methoxy-6-polyprenyl-1,4-benzoquinol methylase